MENEKFFKPLIPEKRRLRYATFDIESNGWINFEMLGFYDGRTYKKFNSVYDFLDYILTERYRGFSFYAHNGGRFDFLFLLGPLTRRNIKFKTVEQGARIVAISFSINKRKYRFIDSFPILSSSLAKLSKTFTPEHAKLSGSIDFENERVDRTNERHQQYLEHDCKSLFEIIEKFQELPFIESVGIKMTAASTAMAAFRTTMKNPIRRTTDEVQEFVRRSYAGGRVEIFKQFETNYTRYDVNSLFPAQMLKSIPLECYGRAHDISDFGFHEVSVFIPDIYIPVLYAHKKGKLVFPTGYLRGVFFSEEIKLAIKNGAKIIKYHQGYGFTQNNDFFRDFVTRLYKIRSEFPSNSPQNYLAKLLLNSCYGKFAERSEKKSIERVDPKDPATWPSEFSEFRNNQLFKKTGLIEITKESRPMHALVHIGAAITSQARIQMHEQYYSKANELLVYTDTDSVDTSFNFPNSQNIGELKKEDEFNKGFYLLPKAYFLELKTPKLVNGKCVKYIKKIKGFKSKYLENIDFELFKSKKVSFSEKRIATFRTSIIRNGSYLSMVDHKRQIVADYDKRVMTANGFTRPWHFKKDGKQI